MFWYIMLSLQYLFDSLKDTAVMKCGHTMHCECYEEMIKRDKWLPSLLSTFSSICLLEQNIACLVSNLFSSHHTDTAVPYAPSL